MGQIGFSNRLRQEEKVVREQFRDCCGLLRVPLALEEEHLHELSGQVAPPLA